MALLDAGSRSQGNSNPISIALELIRAYRSAVQEALVRAGVEPAQAEQALSQVRVTTGETGTLFDQGVWFTLRRPFARSDVPLSALVQELSLHDLMRRAFARFDVEGFYRHQVEATRAILAGRCTVLASGTGSGKTEAFLIPLMERCLRAPGRGVKAIVVYPMNALAEDQTRRIKDYADHVGLRVGRYTGEEDPALRRLRDRLLVDPPDILVTNHVMLERILTRRRTSTLRGIGTLQTVVFDEVHTFRGNVGADVAWLIRRLRAACGTSPVFVGASATLHSRGGYLADDSTGARLRKFLRDLFAPPEGDVELVEPTYVDEPIDGGAFPEPRWSELGWSAGFDQAGTVAHAFLGERSPPGGSLDNPWDFLDEGPRSPSTPSSDADLRGHALVRAWRRALQERGALTYAELVDVARLCYEGSTGKMCPAAEQLVQAGLAAVNHANAAVARDRRDGRPGHAVLDLVTHVVLRNVQGTLKLCLKCGRHHLGLEESCPHCGFHLFDALRADIRWALAAVDYRAQRLSPLPGNQDPLPDLVVAVARLETLDEPPNGAMRIGWADATGEDGVHFLLDGDGELVMRRIAVPGRRELVSLVARPVETSHSLDYLVLLADRVLDLGEQAPRLLVFGDARERVSVAGYVLREHFADGHLCALATQAAGGGAAPLPLALESVLRALREAPQSSYRDELQAAVPLWFVRLCATPCRLFPEHRGVLEPADWGHVQRLGEAAEFLVRTCIEEGAIAWHRVVPAPSHEDRNLFELDHLRRTMRRIVTFERGARAKGGVQSVALTEIGGLYGEQVQRLGGAKLLMSVADALVDRGVLLSVDDALEDGVRGYALDPSAVALSPARDGGAPWEEYRAVGIHTSETPDHARRQLERDFGDQATPLSVIVATSTLEMGVDIGSLRYVLCFGVPPTPANYAQRVGRAGRSAHAWYALSLVWCDDGRPHDLFFFHNPEETRAMLSGQVSPPDMDAENPLVVRRHLFAAAVQNSVDDPLALGMIAGDPDARLNDLPPTLVADMAANVDIRAELRDSLAPFLQQLLEDQAANPTRLLSTSWFESELAPDYGFRRDDVKLILREEAPSSAVANTSTRECVSQRAPEQAVTTWAPGRVVATPRGLMRIDEGLPQPPPTFRFPNPVEGPDEIARYTEFSVSREEGLGGRSDRLPSYQMRSRLDVRDVRKENVIAGPGWVSWRAVPGGDLSVVNFGQRDRQAPIGVPATPWGYRTRCDALLVIIDPLILGQVGIASLVCSLDHAIQHHYHLDDSDLLLLTGVECPIMTDGLDTLVLADAARRGLVSINRLADELPAVLAEALTRLETCDCLDGCYRCLRTFGTARFAVQATRRSARSLIAAILGRGIWIPPLPKTPFTPSRDGEEHGVNVDFHGDQVIWSAAGVTGTVPVPPIPGAIRTSLLQAFSSAIDGIPRGSQVRLRTNRAELARLVTGDRRSRLGERELDLLFRLLAFRVTVDGYAAGKGSG